MRFASALSEHPIPTEAVGEVVGSILEQLDGTPASLVTLFVTPHHAGAVEDIAATVRTILAPDVLVGSTAVAVVGRRREVEDGPGISLFAAHLPGVDVTAVSLSAVQTPDGPAVVGWPDESGEARTLLLLVDPFSFPGDAFLQRLNGDQPELSVIGGLASAARGPGGNRLVVDDQVLHDGAVGVLLGGVEITPVVSQGCRPIGRPYTVTRSERNVVHELGGKPAIQRLEEIVHDADEEERALIGRGLHVGIVVDEHRGEFGRGDFLVRNVVGVDRESGAVALGEFVEVGRTIQFHVRDADSADDDLRSLLADHEADAALLFTCNGRGAHLFGSPDHDATVVDQLLGPVPLAGMFCAGEVGPVGGHNFLHGFTASLLLVRSG